MKTIQLGPMRVSQMALGAMYFGTRSDADTSYALLDTYVARGGNFIDTANNYSFWAENGEAGASERLLGRWLAERGGRDDLVIATKLGALPNRRGAALEDIEGLSADVIARGVDRSLEHLQTDRIDLLYAHIDDRTVPLEETLEAFDRVVRAGKVRAIGCSNYNAWRIEKARCISRANGWAEYACVQQRHSYYQPVWRADFGFRRVMGDRGGWGLEEGTTGEHLDYARTDGAFPIVGYSPLLQGGYARPETLSDIYRTPDNEKRRAALDAVAAETGAEVNQVVLAWMLQSDPVIVPLVAASRPEHLSANLAAADLVLTPEQMRRLDTAVTGDPNR